MADAPDILATPYLTAADMERARGLVFSPRVQPVGQHVGLHASPQVGHAAEFNDYRAYTPGDNLADIDWKVLGRTDRLYVKRFEHQTDLAVTLLIDASASMAYDGGERARRKFDAACRVAALLAVVLLQQHDRVSVGIAQRGLADWHQDVAVLPRLAQVLHALHATTLADRAALPTAIEAVQHRAPARSLLIVLSDLIDDRAATLAMLASHRARGGDALLVHVVHPHELSLPFDRPLVMIDSETGERVEVDGRAQRTRYAQQMAAHIEQWRSSARQAGVDHLLCRSDQTALDTLDNYLAGQRGCITPS